MKPFQIRLKGAFHSYELYNKQGRQVYSLHEAVSVANAEYPDEWTEVYNGETGAINEQTVCQCVRACPRVCTGKCGCKACLREYSEFLSTE